MSLEKPEVLDLVFLTPDKKRVALVAYDGGEVPEPSAREEALQKKLHTYLDFVVSGQFVRTYPEHADRGVYALVVCLDPPTDGMKKIEGIRDHDRPETLLPVEVITDAEFRAAIPKRESPEPKPWWRFWY